MIKSGAPTTFALRVREHVKSRGGTIPSYVELVLKSIQELNVQIAEADQALEDAAASDPTCKLLMTAPGVGPTTAVRFVAAIDNVERFPNAHRLESYLGLTPGENSSSQRKRKTALTKAGPSKMRWVLVQAAWAARRYYRDDPLVLWSKEVERRRGKQVAVMALVRRLTGVLYAMWRDRSPYNKNHRHLETRASNIPA